ncbi:MAG: hypothetical protein EON56_05080 [Alphaproteobacteria bacterium]|nr:MAG: hypothetical protein EON56_05080 [Alphaproteobacteria bacterium]
MASTRLHRDISVASVNDARVCAGYSSVTLGERGWIILAEGELGISAASESCKQGDGSSSLQVKHEHLQIALPFRETRLSG